MRQKKMIYCSFWKLISLLLFSLVLQTGFAQQQDSIPPTGASFLDILRNDSNIALGGLKAVYLSPLNWQKKDFLRAGIIGFGTGLLYTVDEETSRFFIDQREDIPPVLLEVGSLGSPEAIFVLDGAIYLTGLVFKNEKIRHTGLLLVTSATASGLLLSLSKVLVGRARPFTGEGKAEFRPFNFSDDRFRSFPSGHTLFAVSTAYAIGKQFKNPVLKAGIYGLGLIGPASRLWEGEHWVTDVAISTALGVAVVETVDHYLKNQQESSSGPQKKISWSLNFGPTAIGLTGTF